MPRPPPFPRLSHPDVAHEQFLEQGRVLRLSPDSRLEHGRYVLPPAHHAVVVRHGCQSVLVRGIRILRKFGWGGGWGGGPWEHFVVGRVASRLAKDRMQDTLASIQSRP